MGQVCNLPFRFGLWQVTNLPHAKSGHYRIKTILFAHSYGIGRGVMSDSLILNRIVSVCVVLGLMTSTCAAEVFVEHVEPPSLVRGEVTRVTVFGSDMHQAVGLWTSLPKEIIHAVRVGADRRNAATFDVEVAKDANLGFYGLRLATAGGLSNAHIFLIDDLRTTSEEERPTSTNPTTTPQRVELPIAMTGICSAADVDRFEIVVAAGQSVSFEIVGSRLGKDFDPLVTIADHRGRVIAEHDNDSGLFFDTRFEHTFKSAGNYIVEVRDARFRGSLHWTYVLRMGSFPAARVAVPSSVQPGKTASLSFPQLGSTSFPFEFPADIESGTHLLALRRDTDNASAWIPLRVSNLESSIESEPNDDTEHATACKVPGILHGYLERSRDRDYFAFELKKGATLDFKSESKTIGSPADLELLLIDPNGKEVKRGDDSGFEDASFSFAASADGRHTLVIQDLARRGGSEYGYRVEISTRQPKIAMQSGVTRLAIPQGTRQPLPLTLTRSLFAGPVKLALNGAPEGLTLAKTQFTDGESSLDNAIVADPTVPPGVYTLQIQGRAQKGDVEIKGIARTRPLIDRIPTGRGPHGEPFELREDQRRLPPTLTDRIAILVTLSSPFDFELSSKYVAVPRFLNASFEIKTTRVDGFEAPIKFVARGGTLEADGQMRRQVKNQIPVATAESLIVTGTLYSGVLSRPTKHWVTVTGTTEFQGHTVALTRTFELDLRVAFDPAPEPAKIELKPGQSSKISIKAQRLKPFDGPVVITPSKVAGIELPETITIPSGSESVEVEIKISEKTNPKKYSISFPGQSRVNKFQESSSGQRLEVVVVKPE